MIWIPLVHTVPPIGAVYQSHISFAFIGKQNIRLTICDTNTAAIELEGIINIKDSIHYEINRNKFDFTLSDSLKNTLQKYHCALKNAEFDQTNDAAYITCFIKPIRYHHRIELLRFNKKSSIS